MGVPEGQHPAAGQQAYAGQPAAGAAPGPPAWARGPRGKPFFLTSEFLVLVAASVAVLIAAAVAENFEAPHAWTLVAALAALFILSRGIAKSGKGGRDF